MKTHSQTSNRFNCTKLSTETRKPVIAWSRTSRRLDADDGLTPAERSVQATINRAIQIESCRGALSMPQIAKYSGISERQAYRVVKSLREKGRIEVTPGGGRDTNFYALTWGYIGQQTPAKSAPNPPPPCQESTPDTPQDGPVQARLEPRARVEDKKTHVEKTTEKPAVVLSAEQEELKHALIERQVEPRKASQIAAITPLVAALAILLTADEYVRRQTWVRSLGGVYVTAFRQGWGIRKPLTSATRSGRCVPCGGHGTDIFGGRCVPCGGKGWG